MSQQIACPHCKQPLILPAGLSAAQIRCPRCKKPFALPNQPAAVQAVPVPAPLPPPRPASASRCPECQSPLRPGAKACLECGHLLGKSAAVAPAPLPTPAPAPLPTSAPAPLPTSKPVPAPAGFDIRPWMPALRLLPAGLLGFILLLFMVRDRFVGGETETETEADVVELPVDPDPLLAVNFQSPPDHSSGTMRFGLTMLTENDAKGKPKRLTFTPDGGTNNAVMRIDGESLLFGKFFFGRGGSGRKGEDGNFVADPKQDLPILRGRWREPGNDLGNDRTGRTRIGLQSIYFYEDRKIAVTQTVEIVPGEQVAPGQSKRRLDTCLVRYRLDNEDDQPHRLGFRFVLDTFIGSNDGVPFTIPGASGLCNTSRDFDKPESVPDFIQALEHPSIEKPGTVAHLTLRLGGGLDAPDRVTLGRWINQLQWGAFEKPHVDWPFPVRPMKDDSGVVLYWNEKEVAAGGHRELGFAYGLGNVSSGEGGGKLGLTVGGSFRPGDEFTVTAYVNEPLPHQTVTLELPRGLTRVDGEATQSVPPLPDGAASRNSPVTWKVKSARPGRFTLRVRASNGVTQSQIVTISSKGIFD